MKNYYRLEMKNMADDIRMSVEALNSRITTEQKKSRRSKMRRKKPLGNSRR